MSYSCSRMLLILSAASLQTARYGIASKGYLEYQSAAVRSERLHLGTCCRNAGYLPVPTFSGNKFRDPERQPDADDCLYATDTAGVDVLFG